MRHTRGWMAAALALALMSCGQSSETMSGGAPAAGEGAQGFAAPPMEEAARDMDAATNAAPPAPATAPQPAQQGPQTTPDSASPAPILYLAYSYFVEAELPADRLAGVMDAHLQACTAAGPRLCQLIGSTRSGEPTSDMRGELYIRGEPQWLRTYMGRLQTDAETAGGRIRQQSTNTEDLTRAIVDTEARLRASRALRDRLQNLLESRPGRLSDLLEVERELARVQGEIDATDSNLAVMRTRVAMSELRINYVSQPRALGSDTFEPLRNAFAGFLRLVVEGFAAIITFIAQVLPGVIVLGLIAWGVLAWRRRNGGRFLKRDIPKPDASASPSP